MTTEFFRFLISYRRILAKIPFQKLALIQANYPDFPFLRRSATNKTRRGFLQMFPRTQTASPPLPPTIASSAAKDIYPRKDSCRKFEPFLSPRRTDRASQIPLNISGI